MDVANHAAGTSMKDTATAAVLGLIIGYMIRQYWSQLESLLRLLTG
jgi:hypothetical protein